MRNGVQIKGQAMTYLQCNFCSSMVDADLYLLQILATQLPPLNFMSTVIEKYDRFYQILQIRARGLIGALIELFCCRFHVSEWFSFLNNADRANVANDGDNDTPMVESFLQFLATLCCNRTNLGSYRNIFRI